MATDFNPRSLLSSTFDGLHHSVSSTFSKREKELKELLKSYQLEVYFLTDPLRGEHVIRTYIQSIHFEKFSVVDRKLGGKYFGFCDIYQVSYENSLLTKEFCF